MKKHIIVLMLLSITIMTSCKKKEEEEKLDTQQQQFNSDANNYKAESDQADQDINSKLQDIPAFGKGGPPPAILSSPLCGVTIDTTNILQKIVVFNFDGVTPCFSPSRTRSGQIKVQLTTGSFWRDAGSVITLTYINFKVTRMSDNKSIAFNGVKTLKNINGNNWLGFVLGTANLKYRERAFNVQVTFDNSLQAFWNSARTTQWSYTPADQRVTFTSNGDTTLNGYANVDSWGVNRFTQAFTTYYTAALVSNSYCGYWRPNSGELVHHVNSNDFRLSLGVDQQGNPSPYACAYGYKVTWTNSSGGTSTVILSY